MAEEEVNPEELEIADELIAERRAESPGETPEDMTSWQRPITAAIDVINYRAGQIIALLMVPLIAVVVFEVISRNSFAILQDAGFEDFARAIGLGPTLWVYDTSRMMAGVLFMAAAGYGLMRGVHIRADFLYRNWSAKTQATVDATLYLLFFIPSMIFFTVIASEFWWLAFSTKETMQIDSAWGPLCGPRAWRCRSVVSCCYCRAFPEIFRAFHKMGKQRERWFVRALPVYLIALTWLVLAVFQPDLVPGGEAFSDLMSARPDMDKATIGLIMLGAMLFVIFIGFPISFTLIFLAFVFGIWGSNFKLTTLLMTLNTNSTMLNDQLMAVPLFVLMGIIMEAAGLMDRLFASIQMIMARVRGALVHRRADRIHNFCRRHRHRGRFRDPARDHGWRDHESVPLQRPACGRNHHRRRHIGHSDPALDHADRHGTRAGSLNPRPVPCRLYSRRPAGVSLPALHPGTLLAESGARAHSGGRGPTPDLLSMAPRWR